MANNKGQNIFTSLAPELHIKIFQALPNLHSVIALRLTCSQLDELYVRYEGSIKVALRDRIVHVIDSFYLFLTTLHIPRSALKHPPPGGWPHITPQGCVRFEKTDFAIDILRHLPYVTETANRRDNLHNIELGCYVLDYSTRKPADFRSVKVITWSSEPLSKHMVPITTSYGNSSMEMVLDTMRAEMNLQLLPFGGDLVMDIEKCFSIMAGRCQNLEIMFVPGHDPIVDIKWSPEEGDGSECLDDMGSLMAQEYNYPTRRDARWIRYLYCKAGWPGPDFQKERALRAVRMFVEARMG